MLKLFIFALAVLVTEPAFAEELTMDQRSFPVVSVPHGAQRVSLIQLKLKANCDEDAIIKEVIVKHGGLGASSDIERVYLAEGNRRMSSSQSFSSNTRTAILRPMALTVKKCQERTIEVRGDFSADAATGGEHRLIVSALRLGSGNLIQPNVGSATLTAKTVPQTTGAVTVEFLPLLDNVRFGAGKTVARFRLSADNEQDQLIGAMTLTNDGSARNSDLRNLKLMNGQKVLSDTLDRLDGSVARFTLDQPLRIGKNATVLLIVKADVRASAKRTIRFIVEEPSDIEAAPEQRLRPNTR